MTLGVGFLTEVEKNPKESSHATGVGRMGNGRRKEGQWGG